MRKKYQKADKLAEIQAKKKNRRQHPGRKSSNTRQVLNVMDVALIERLAEQFGGLDINEIQQMDEADIGQMLEMSQNPTDSREEDSFEKR